MSSPDRGAGRRAEEGIVRLPTLEDIRRKHGTPEPAESPLAFFLNKTGNSPSQHKPTPQQQAMIEAEHIRQAAQDEADTLRRQAGDELEAARREAEGIRAEARRAQRLLLKETEEEAQRRLQAQQHQLRSEHEASLLSAIEALDARYAQAGKRLAEARDTLFAQLEPQLLDIVLDIARKILTREFDKNDEVYPEMVRHALRLMSERELLQLRVSPWEHARFFEGADRPLARELAERGIRVVIDATLPKSQCRLETDCGSIEAGIDCQMDRLAAALHADADAP